MSQCRALFYPRTNSAKKIGYYCVLPEGHWGGHKTDHGEHFAEHEATYLNRPETLPNPPPTDCTSEPKT